MYTLLSNEPISLSKLFSKDRKIVIPDMQREYCWAETKSEINNKSLVENFVNDMVTQSRLDSPTQMGLLYAYESPQNHIQLCDGQQRITTLYIMIGILYRYIKNTDKEFSDKILPILISDFELKEDDREPRLQYAIRESTLLFLRDLVYYYFLGEVESISDDATKSIKKEFWYFDEYDLDPTIKNILIAISNIEGVIKKDDIDKNKLLEYITTKVSFLYFDMVNRNHGEEQFVVINTTGKPLTITENFKPKFLGGLNNTEIKYETKTELRHYSDMWEEWENFFWQNKKGNDLTADNGLNEFFRWVFILEKSNDQISSDKEKYSSAQNAIRSESEALATPYDLLSVGDTIQDSMDKIDRYYDALMTIKNKNLYDNIDNIIGNKLFGIESFSFLPLLLYVKNNIDTIEKNRRNIKRLNYFFKSRAKNENISKSPKTTVIEAIRIVKYLADNNTQDIAECIKFNDISKMILSDGEKFKFNVYKNKELVSADERIKYEDIFWKAEDLDCCKGNISYIFESIMDIDFSNKFNNVEYETFTKVVEVLEQTFNKPTDIMRRALLTFGDYCKWNGNTPSLDCDRYSFGYDANFFRGILQNNSDKSFPNFIKFFKSIFDSDDINLKMNNLINEYQLPNTDDIWTNIIGKLIKEKDLFKYSERKLVAYNGNNQKTYILKNIKATSKDTYKEIIISSPNEMKDIDFPYKTENGLVLS